MSEEEEMARAEDALPYASLSSPARRKNNSATSLVMRFFADKNNVALAVVVVASVLMILQSEFRARAVQRDADERDAASRAKLEEMEARFRTRCGVSDHKLQLMEVQRVKLKACQTERVALLGTISDHEKKEADANVAVDALKDEVNRLTHEVVAIKANALVHSVKDEEVHCREAMTNLTLAKKHVADAEKACARRLEESDVKISKWKRKHETALSKAKFAKAESILSEARAKEDQLKQNFAVTLAMHHTVKDAEWKIAARLVKFKLDDDDKSVILSKCHRTTDEVDLMSKLERLARMLDKAHEEREAAKAEYENAFAPMIILNPGEARVNSSALLAAACAEGNCNGSTTANVAPASPPISSQKKSVSCWIPQDSDVEQDTIATLVTGVSPSVFVEGMPEILCLKRSELVTSSLWICSALLFIATLALIALYSTARFAARLALHTVAFPFVVLRRRIFRRCAPRAAAAMRRKD